MIPLTYDEAVPLPVAASCSRPAAACMVARNPVPTGTCGAVKRSTASQYGQRAGKAQPPHRRHDVHIVRPERKGTER